MNLFTEIKINAYNLKAEMPMPIAVKLENSQLLVPYHRQKKTLKDLPLFFLMTNDKNI